MVLLAPPALQAPAPSEAPRAPLALDLAAALARARNENPMLRAAKARVDERRGLITSTRADALPQLTMIGDFTRARDVSILNSGFADIAATSGLSPSSLVGARSIYTSQANLTQPLFYWGKLGTAINIAKMGEKEAGYGFTTAELDVLHGVAKAYLAVLTAQAEQEVVETRRKTAEQFVSDVKARLEAQTATELDRLRAESELLAVIPEALQADANVKRALEVLNGQLGLDPKTPLALAQLGQPELGARPAGAERSELAQLKQVKQLRVDRERSIAIEQSTADRELEKAIALAEASGKAHDATVEALRMSRESFDQGLITSLDLLQAERSERQAESQRRRAELGLWSARFDQRRALGLPPL